MFNLFEGGSMKKSYLIVLISLALFSLVLIVGYLSYTYFTIPDTTNTPLQLQNMEEFRRSFFNDGEAFVTSNFEETVIKSGLIVLGQLVQATPTDEGYVIYEFNILSSIKNPKQDTHVWLYEPAKSDNKLLYSQDFTYLLFLSRTIDVYDKNPIYFNFGSVFVPIDEHNELKHPSAFNGFVDLARTFDLSTYEDAVTYINEVREKNTLFKDGIYDYHGRFIDSTNWNTIVEEADYILEVTLEEILHQNRILQECLFTVNTQYKGDTERQIIISIPSYVSLQTESHFIVCLFKDANYTVAGYTSVIPYSDQSSLDDVKEAITSYQQSIHETALKLPKVSLSDADLKLPDLKREYTINPLYQPFVTINKDVVGWFKIEGTTIDYPVLQGSDNDYYLKHDINNKPSTYGSIIMDYRCNIESIQRNTMVYGHNMKRDIMFHDIVNYKNSDFLKAHPIIEFNTLYDTMRWEVFAVYVVDGGYVYSISYPLSADEEFQAYLDDIASKNMYQNTLDITMNDHLLTLVTCSYEFDNARTIVHARLIYD